MKQYSRTVCIVLMTLFSISFQAYAVPQMINYQGQVTVEGAVFSGAANFRFAIVDGVGNYYWSNDDNTPPVSPPTTDVSLSVTEGLFNVILGRSGSMADIPASIFEEEDLYLRIWFDDGLGHGLQQLTPDQSLSSCSFAYKAQNSNELEGHSSSDFMASGTDDWVNESGDTMTGALNLPSNGLTVGSNQLKANSGRIGIGTANPAQMLDVAGTVQMTGFKMTTGANNGYVLTCNSSGVGSWSPVVAGDITAVHADNGLAGGETSGEVHLSIVEGDGIDVHADSVSVDVTEFAGDGLGTASSDLKVNTGTGLEVSGDYVQLNSSYSSGSAYDGRFVNDNAGEVDGADIVFGTTLTGSAYYSGFTVQNNQTDTFVSHGVRGISNNYTEDWYHYGVYGIAGDNHGVMGAIHHAGVFGGGKSGYSNHHGVIGLSLNGRGVWGLADHWNGGIAGYFDGDVVISYDLDVGGSKSGWVTDVCFNADKDALESGDVVVLSGDPTEQMMYATIPVPIVKKCDSEADTNVMGVVIKRKKITPYSLEVESYETLEAAEAAGAHKAKLVGPLRETLEEAKLDRSIVPPEKGCYVAILGAIEKCKVDAGYGAIEVGDLLTTSETPGHAMKARNPKLGTIIGKALEPLEQGQGIIKISVTLR